MLIVTHQTPPATASGALHRWEEAEVFTPDAASGKAEEYVERTFEAQQAVPHPYSRKSLEKAAAAAAKGKGKSTNPFRDTTNPFEDAFNTQPVLQLPPPLTANTMSSRSSYSTQAATVSPSTPTGPRMFARDSESEREARALDSLIAALNIGPEEAARRLSAQGKGVRPRESTGGVSAKSVGSDLLGEDGLERFPLPPDTQVDRRKSGKSIKSMKSVR